MAKGHGTIVNLETYLPFIFTYNPEKVDSTKKINYFSAPNIGGSYHEKYFTGFENKEISFKLVCIDMDGPMGVTEEIAYFEALREPAPGILGIANIFESKTNYPPPQVLFQFGVSVVPLVWDVVKVDIDASLFHDGHVRGVMGIPKRAEISISLSLDEGHVLNKANMIAKKASEIAGSAESVTKEIRSKSTGSRKDNSGSYPFPIGGMW